MIISNQNGFTYILALTIVVIMGIMLGLTGQSWHTLKQRELEDEMIFRGGQVAELIYQKTLCTSLNDARQSLWPVNTPNGSILDDLVLGREERCFGGAPPRKFRLRQSAAIDPITGKPWKIVPPVGDNTRFAGVASESNDEPFRQSFKSIFDSSLLDGKKKYSDWLFTWELKKPAAQIIKTQ